MKLRYKPTILCDEIKSRMGNEFQTKWVYWSPEADTSVIDCGVSLAKVLNLNMPKKLKIIAALKSK